MEPVPTPMHMSGQEWFAFRLCACHKDVTSTSVAGSFPHVKKRKFVGVGQAELSDAYDALIKLQASLRSDGRESEDDSDSQVETGLTGPKVRTFPCATELLFTRTVNQFLKRDRECLGKTTVCQIGWSPSPQVGP